MSETPVISFGCGSHQFQQCGRDIGELSFGEPPQLPAACKLTPGTGLVCATCAGHRLRDRASFRNCRERR